jgi:hypothetical protein
MCGPELETPNGDHAMTTKTTTVTKTEIAARINALMEPLNRQVVSRYGMDIFQQIEPTFTLALDYTYILYRFPGVAAYIHPFVADDERITAFENEVALRVHLHCTRSRVAPIEILTIQPKES